MCCVFLADLGRLQHDNLAACSLLILLDESKMSALQHRPTDMSTTADRWKPMAFVFNASPIRLSRTGERGVRSEQHSAGVGREMGHTLDLVHDSLRYAQSPYLDYPQ